MLKKLSLPLVVLLILALALPMVSCGTDSKADIIITNANVYTVDKDKTVTEAVAIKGEEIVYVGDAEGVEEFKSDNTEVIDAEGATILPGMVDSHMHPAMSAVMYAYEIAIPEDVMDEKEYLNIISEFIKENPDREVYAGSGFMRSLYDTVGPRKEDLDKIESEKPIIITSSDGHSKWVNSKAMELAGITKDTKDPEGGVIQRDPSTGEPAGLLQESAANLVEDLIPEYTQDEYIAAMKETQDWFNSVGITTVFDAMIPTDNDEYYKSYEKMAKDGDLNLRIRGGWHIYPELGSKDEILDIVDKSIAKSKELKDPLFQINAFKFFADQVLEEETAYLSEPYANHDDGYRGIRVWKDEVIEPIFTKIDKEGYQIHSHQIGDAAATYIIDNIEKAIKTNGERDSRHALAHVQMVNDDDIKRMGELKMTAVVAPYWSVIDDYHWSLNLPYLGEERVSNCYPAQSFLNNDVNVAFHSDFFVSEPDPGYMIYSAQTRTLPERIFKSWYGEESGFNWTTDYDVKLKEGDIGPLPQSDERMSLEDSIYAATYGGAYANFMEDEIGSIEVGKKADLIIYGENIFELDLDGIADIIPSYTIFNGKIVYDAKKAEEAEE